jgi:hypothetical protein
VLGLGIGGVAIFAGSHEETPKVSLDQKGTVDGVNVQVGGNAGSITVIRNGERTQDPTTDLQIVEMATSDHETLDVKLKNSGTDSVFITGVRFVMKPALVGNSACNPVPATHYSFCLEAACQGQTVRISPTFVPRGALYLKGSVDSDTGQRSWTLVPFGEGMKKSDKATDEAFKKAEEMIKKKVGTVALAQPLDLKNDSVLEELFAKFPSQQYGAGSKEAVVYFARDLDMMGGLVFIMRVSTTASQRLPLSQVVPPRGVDRFQVHFRLPDDHFKPWAEVFLFEGYAILEYDKNKELRTPSFSLCFVSPEQRERAGKEAQRNPTK